MPRGVSRHLQNEIQSSLLLDARSHAFLTADVVDYDLSVGTAHDIGSSGGDWTIKSIAGGTEKRVLELCNVSSRTVYLAYDSAAGTSNCRIYTGMPANAAFPILAGQSISLVYSNTLQRWVVQHGAVLFDGETDTPLTALLGGARPAKRFRPFMDVARDTFLRALGSGYGYMKLAGYTIKTNGPVNQAFGAVTGAQVSFTMPATGKAVAMVLGTFDHVAFIIDAYLGARFDSDTPQKLNGFECWNGAGADNLTLAGQSGFLPKSALSAGAHTADLCAGTTSGTLLASATYPAIIAVFIEG